MWPLRQLIPVFVSHHLADLLAFTSSSFRLLCLSQSSSSCSLATSDSSSDSSVQRQHLLVSHAEAAAKLGIEVTTFLLGVVVGELSSDYPPSPLWHHF